MKRNGSGDLHAEIVKIEAEISRIEALGPPLDECQDRALAELDQAEAVFRQRGLSPFGRSASESAHLQRLAHLGALLAIDTGGVIRKLERQRVERAFDRAGGGMATAEKERRLTELRAQLRRLHAQREIAWRQAEADGAEIVDRSAGFDPEAFLRVDQDLEAIAAGKEPAE